MKTLADKENADMHALLISYHIAVIDLIEAYNRDSPMEDEVVKLESICRNAEPYTRKHEHADLWKP